MTMSLNTDEPNATEMRIALSEISPASTYGAVDPWNGGYLTIDRPLMLRSTLPRHSMRLLYLIIMDVDKERADRPAQRVRLGHTAA